MSKQANDVANIKESLTTFAKLGYSSARHIASQINEKQPFDSRRNLFISKMAADALEIDADDEKLGKLSKMLGSIKKFDSSESTRTHLDSIESKLTSMAIEKNIKPLMKKLNKLEAQHREQDRLASANAETMTPNTKP